MQACLPYPYPVTLLAFYSSKQKRRLPGETVAPSSSSSRQAAHVPVQKIGRHNASKSGWTEHDYRKRQGCRTASMNSAAKRKSKETINGALRSPCGSWASVTAPAPRIASDFLDGGYGAIRAFIEPPARAKERTPSTEQRDIAPRSGDVARGPTTSLARYRCITVRHAQDQLYLGRDDSVAKTIRKEDT